VVDDKLFNEVYSVKKFNLKRFVRPIIAAFAMAVAMIILIWVFSYFNQGGENIILTHLELFFINNWYYIAGFVLVIGIWDYLYDVYEKTIIRYLAPSFDALSSFFAIWLISVILNGLRIFVNEGDQLNLFLKFLYDLFYQQTILLFVFLILVFYSKFFLNDRSY
jgi:hypothetical protein